MRLVTPEGVGPRESDMSSPNRSPGDPDRIERIRLSHYRSDRAGLSTDDRLRVVTEEFDPDSRLLAASRPVIRRLTDALDGLMAGGLLTDRNGTVVERYFGDDRMARAADRLGAVLGASFNEDRTGTNGISLPLETRTAILVCADEHYLEDLKSFTCYGVPIVNPATNRLEGVVDLMVEGPVTPGVMAGLLDRAVDEIRGQLLGDYDPDIALSVAAFKRLSGRTQDGITLIARDFIVHNLRAADLVTGEDAETLREIAGRLGPDSAEMLQLSSGVDITITATPTASEGTVLLRLSDGNQHRTPIPRRSGTSPDREATLDRVIADVAATGDSVFVVGERGSGRTRAAKLLTHESPAVVIDAALESPETTRSLIRALVDSRDALDSAVVIEHAELFSPETCRAVIDLARHRPDVRLIVTAAPSFRDRPEVEYLASTFCSWIEIPPLRQRVGDFAVIVNRIVDEVATARQIPASSRPGVTRSTIQHLKSLPWPGNVAELYSVLDATIVRRSVGDIVISDLPERYRRASGARMNLTPMEQVERDVIIEALSVANGNKVQTAQHLGISRSKLYDRIRHFKIEIH